MLEVVMQQIKARELIDDPDYCGQLTMGEFHTLLLKAGYSPEVAQKAANQRGWDRLSAGVKM